MWNASAYSVFIHRRKRHDNATSRVPCSTTHATTWRRRKSFYFFFHRFFCRFIHFVCVHIFFYSHLKIFFWDLLRPHACVHITISFLRSHFFLARILWVDFVHFFVVNFFCFRFAICAFRCSMKFESFFFRYSSRKTCVCEDEDKQNRILRVFLRWFLHSWFCPFHLCAHLRIENKFRSSRHQTKRSKVMNAFRMFANFFFFIFSFANFSIEISAFDDHSSILFTFYFTLTFFCDKRRLFFFGFNHF